MATLDQYDFRKIRRSPPPKDVNKQEIKPTVVVPPGKLTRQNMTFSILLFRCIYIDFQFRQQLMMISNSSKTLISTMTMDQMLVSHPLLSDLYLCACPKESVGNSLK